uniref:Uncharacterized protein n=1 Tax=Lotharella globosa TaxID=91324 RepID=A0A7S4DWL6_9EUKA|mmetsp:Transcript_28192/g.54934  ORF Transcript_28192/g.54934 Transcript_28192/m.54934 type:complete len:218 (+) Transcript_28192:46-699(+)|eukprot:CAMPEP_0167784406 /NCGR_PEP_ID=MMETSP0111_2-20121227/7619_1 /TAXON_ID=91324 /ORGANISM="Lotharella globosa, Strain CCCM811" /LENGTH=217 /DNA_ID=CAMNT_0007675473 /DNA_START=34 /DNA_END=687 /DNA_ORIENTATION=-
MRRVLAGNSLTQARRVSIAGAMLLAGLISVGVYVRNRTQTQQPQVDSSLQEVQKDVQVTILGKKALDLNGTWRLKHTEGDIDAFLKSRGFPWVIRVMAAMILKSRYPRTERIRMDDKTFYCEEKGAPMNERFHQKYKVHIGGGEIPFIEPSGDRTRVKYSWENGKKKKLVFKSYGKFNSVGCRYLRGNEMHVKVCCSDEEGRLTGGDMTCIYEKIAD